MAAKLTLELAAGELRTGRWCSRCMLPSAVEVEVLWLRSDGISTLGTYRQCLDCGEFGKRETV